MKKLLIILITLSALPYGYCMDRPQPVSQVQTSNTLHAAQSNLSRGLELVLQQKKQEAIPYLLAAYNNPQFAVIHFAAALHLGLIYAKLGNDMLARDYLTTAAEQNFFLDIKDAAQKQLTRLDAAQGIQLLQPIPPKQ
ncbi:MAG: hypothetical protein AB7F19_04410 [Candidatus Babeliales bacterium]